MTNTTHPDVLIVDDSKAILMMLSNAMKARGFVVETASSGEDALEILKTRPFGLVLIDLLMPGMDGLEVCQRLSTYPQRSQFKVVICSGCDELDVIQGSMGTGADAYFVKEGTPEQFADNLAMLFEGIHSSASPKTEPG